MLWFQLQARRASGFHFRRNQAIDGYVVDFCCPSARLVVQLVERSSATPLSRYLEHRGYAVYPCEIDDAKRDPVATAKHILELCRGVSP